MLIQELTKQESLEVLARTHLGRLACARGMQPYVVPIYFAYHNHWLYSFSVLGQKIDWMRTNPLVCVEADQMRREQWATCAIAQNGPPVRRINGPELTRVGNLRFEGSGQILGGM